MAEFNPTEDSYVLINPTTGELKSVPKDEADKQATGGNFRYATMEEIERNNFVDRNKGAGNVALGTAERVARVLSLGKVDKLSGTEEQARERAKYVDEEHPVISTAATAVPFVAAEGAAVAAAPFTGGASLVAGAALGGALGAYGSVGEAENEAFKRDVELTAEQTWEAAGTGFLFGAGTAAGGALLSKAGGAIRNRVVEASSRVTRQAEQRAAESVGLVGVENRSIFKAIDNPEQAATFRKAADEARPTYAQKAQEGISELDTVAANLNQSTASRALDDAFPGSTVVDDTTRSAPALQSILTRLEKELPPDSSYRAVTGSWLDQISATGKSSDGLLSTADDISKQLDTLIAESRDPALVKQFQSTKKDLTDYSKSEALFGEQRAMSAAEKAAKLDELQEARSSLGSLLEANDLPSVVGTRAGKDIQAAAERYAQAAKDLDPSVAGSVDEALGKLKPPEAVVSGNQVDALLAAPKPKAAKKTLWDDVKGEVADLGVDVVLNEVGVPPGFGLLRKAWKYRKHIFGLSENARGQATEAAGKFLSRVGEKGGVAARGAARATYTQLFPDIPGGTDEERYQSLRTTIQKLNQEPDRIADALASQMGDIPYENPDLHMAVAAKTAQAVAFINSKLPPTFGFSLMNPEGPPPSRTDMLELSLYVRGATQPTAVLQGIADGSAMPEEVEAFRAVFPAWFSEFQENLSQKVQEDARNGKPLPGMRIAQLTGLLDLDGGLDPTFGKDVALIAQTADQINRQQEKRPTYIPPPRTGEKLKTKPIGVS